MSENDRDDEQYSTHTEFDSERWAVRMARKDRVARMAGIRPTPQTLVGMGVIGVRLLGLMHDDAGGDGWMLGPVRPQWAAPATARLGGLEGATVRHMGGFWGWASPHGVRVPGQLGHGGGGLWVLHMHTPGRQRRLGLSPEGVMGEPPESFGEKSRDKFMVDTEERGPGERGFEIDWWKMVGVTGHLSYLMSLEQAYVALGVPGGWQGAYREGHPTPDELMKEVRQRAEGEIFLLQAGDLVGQAMVWDEGDMPADFKELSGIEGGSDEEMTAENDADVEHATDMMIQHSIDGI